MRKTNEVLTFNEEKIRNDLSVIHADYWKLNSWTSSEEGHRIFSFLLLIVIQRVYLAHRYYLH